MHCLVLYLQSMDLIGNSYNLKLLQWNASKCITENFTCKVVKCIAYIDNSVNSELFKWIASKCTAESFTCSVWYCVHYLKYTLSSVLNSK